MRLHTFRVYRHSEVLNYPTPLPSIDYLMDSGQVVFVSTTSDDHYQYSKISNDHVRQYYPYHKYILYGLNLSDDVVKRLPKEDPNFEFRQFDTSRYPKYVEEWDQYRFKSLIMAEMLMEFRHVWWIDAHMKMVLPIAIGNFFDEVARNRSTDDYSSITSFSNSNHSNFATLVPELLEYFPSNSLNLLKSSYQVQAGIIHFSRTEKTMEIFKWFVLCALDEECMSHPPGTNVDCYFGPNRMEYFANCFRYDQSVLNLLLLNKYQDHNKYYTPLNGTFAR
ncbi:unnamed protein product [Caenorhabditis nigoni]